MARARKLKAYESARARAADNCEISIRNDVELSLPTKTKGER